MNSKRFRPSTWSKWLVPFLLSVLSLGLLSSLVIIGMSLIGFKLSY